MEFSELTPEQQEMAKACKTPEELLALAKEHGYELSDDDLDAISGGKHWYDTCYYSRKCPEQCPHAQPYA